MASPDKRKAASLAERTLLIALICLEIAFVTLFALGTGLVPHR